MHTTIQKCDDNSTVFLPGAVLSGAKMEENDKVVISVSANHITIRKTDPASPKRKTVKSLRKRVEEFYGVDFENAVKMIELAPEEISWGEPVGQEDWWTREK